MTSNPFTTEPPRRPDEVIKSVEQGLLATDAERVKGYAELATLRGAKSRSLVREQRLLELKHGGRPHPRIGQARQLVVANNLAAHEIATAHAIFATPLPELSPDSFTVHGFIRQQLDRSGIPGLTVALTDTSGSWLRDAGYACTDERGYFLLRIHTRKGDGGDKPTGDLVQPELRDRAPTAQLRVFDAQGRVLHVEKNNVSIKPGGLDYRVIYLGEKDSGCTCTPPPGSDIPPSHPSPATPRESHRPKQPKSHGNKGRGTKSEPR